MCDTFVSTPQASADGLMILAKNSDRQPNEAQNVTFVPAQDHLSKSLVRCTYIEIPQVRHTYALLLSRPFWMFGAEMGVNENGVAIGNEAVFTKEPYHKKNDALLGMDILRLALERSKTAREAHDVIIELIAKYDQGGNCTMNGSLYYHNSFLIADPEEAIILETAGMHWVSKKVDSIGSISNCLTLDDSFDDASNGLAEYARSRGYVKKGKQINFKRDFSDPIYTYFVKGRVRQSYSYNQLRARVGKITSMDMMAILRNHYGEPYHPGKAPMKQICLHAGGIISTQSTGSMVVVLKKGLTPLVYLTGTSAPCMSLYKPHTISKNQKKYKSGGFFQSPAWGGIDLYGSAQKFYEKNKLWWIGEDIHRRVLNNYQLFMPLVSEKRNRFEKEMVIDTEKKWKKNDRINFTAWCRSCTETLLDANIKIAENIIDAYKKNKVKKIPFWFSYQWKNINRQARFTFKD